MTVFITLTLAGANVGPFNLYSNVDGYVTAFESGVSSASLLAGYSSSLVPDYTTTIRLLSTGECNNYFDIELIDPTSTTTTTTTAIVLQEALVSSTSDPSDACGLPMPNTCWVSGTGDISNGDVVYIDALGTTPFVGDGNFYRIQILIYPNSYSVQINGFGIIDATLGGICP